MNVGQRQADRQTCGINIHETSAMISLYNIAVIFLLVIISTQTTPTIHQICDLTSHLKTCWIYKQCKVLHEDADWCSEQQLLQNLLTEITNDQYLNLAEIPYNSVSTCVEDSSQSSCTNYVYPQYNVTMDLMNLCKKSVMIGCSVLQRCNQGTISGPVCSPFPILGDICAKDKGMESMTGCKNYVSLCSSNSVVKQCSTSPPLSHIITTSGTKGQVLDMCNEMPMDGCEKCQSRIDCPDPLGTISQICLEMNMGGCEDFYMMCEEMTSVHTNNVTSICPSDSKESYPLMRMYFHTGINDYVLFRSWVPTTGGQYAGTCIAVVCFGTLSMFLRRLRQRFDLTRQFDDRGYNSPLLQKSGLIFKSHIPSSSDLGNNSIRMLISGLIFTLDYLLMLIAMTFNVGIFICVIGGLCLGILLFGHEVAIGVSPVADIGCCD